VDRKQELFLFSIIKMRDLFEKTPMLNTIYSVKTVKQQMLAVQEAFSRRQLSPNLAVPFLAHTNSIHVGG
jgi:hypothetical protein